jgi:hypothetical protein
MDEKPTPRPVPTKPVETPGVPRIRTYAADMSRAIRLRGETLSSIVGAEQEAREKAEKPEANKVSRKTLALLAAAVGLPILGIVVVAAALIITAPEGASAPFPAGIIFSNSTKSIEVPLESSLAEVLARERADADLLLGDVERFVVTEGEVPLSPQSLASRLGFPEAVAREVTGAMVGIHAFDRNQPFAILQVAAYDRAFNALLEWESEAARDLGPFFAPTNAPPTAPRLVFTDRVYRNLDVRQGAPSDEGSASWPILYTFPSRSLLIVTTNEFTLREITTRLGNSAL